MDSPELRDDIDNFHLDREKILLDDAGYSDDSSMDDLSEEETEVLPLEDNDQYYVSDSESEGSKVGTIAWGSSKRAFYSQNEVGMSSSDEGAEFEEKEAIELQEKLALGLSEADFLSVQALGGTDDTETTEVPLDLSHLADKDKLALIQRVSPELQPLIQSLRNSCIIITTKLHPLLEATNDDKVKTATELKLHLHMCYTVNVMFYLLLKACRQSTQVHPVFTRLLSLKQLISQVDSLQSSSVQMKVPRSVVTSDKPTEHAQKEDPLQYYERIKKAKGQRKAAKVEEMIPEPEFEDGEKRPITYQISRNKGLTPRRAKIQRNPRVKHRRKFKRALQKRKGQVLPVTSELSRYGGETSGIRSHVSRSVKIK